MTSKRRRGRPFKDVFPEIPAHIPRVKGKAKNPFKAAIESICRELRIGQPSRLPDRLLIELSALWEYEPSKQQSFQYEYEGLVKKITERLEERQKTGTATTKKTANDRAHKLCQKNILLIQRIPRTESINSAAERIHDEWESTPPRKPDGLSERGIGGKPPSISTLTRYIKFFLLVKKRVRQGS
jgi:hypothetical protein